jgi:hypothetical protein
MTFWSVDERLEISLEDVHDVQIKVVGGDVAVTTAPGPVTLDIHVQSGPPVEVVHEHEQLRIAYPEWPLSGLRNLIEGWTGRKAAVSVALTVPDHTRVDVTTVSAPVVASGLAMPVHVNTVSGDVTLQGLTDGVDVKTVSGAVYAAGIDTDQIGPGSDQERLVVEGHHGRVSPPRNDAEHEGVIVADSRHIDVLTGPDVIPVVDALDDLQRGRDQYLRLVHWFCRNLRDDVFRIHVDLHVPAKDLPFLLRRGRSKSLSKERAGLLAHFDQFASAVVVTGITTVDSDHGCTSLFCESHSTTL